MQILFGPTVHLKVIIIIINRWIPVFDKENYINGKLNVQFVNVRNVNNFVTRVNIFI